MFILRMGMAALVLTSAAAAQERVSFPSTDGGVVVADLYGTAGKGVVLAHGSMFNKESWAKQASELVKAGFRVLAIDFRGYGESKAGTEGKALYNDVLGAVRYLHSSGVKSVSVVGGSMGGGASAEAAVHARPGEIGNLVLLAAVPIAEPEKMKGRKLFLVSSGDALAAKVREQFARAPEPKELIVLEGAAHAQHLFATDQGERVMREIVRFLSQD